jgi:hypothetical protein
VSKKEYVVFLLVPKTQKNLRVLENSGKIYLAQVPWRSVHCASSF